MGAYGNTYIRSPRFVANEAAGMELSPPFQIKVDPETGVVGSGSFDDIESVDRFSAHYKVDPSNGDIHFMGQGFFSPVVTYGVLDADMNLKHKLPLPFAFPPPAFLHD